MKSTKLATNRKLVQYTYACLVFREIDKLEDILDKNGKFLGLDYYRFLLFLRIEFEKNEDDCVFDLDGMLKGNHIDLGLYPGEICFLFKKMRTNDNKPTALLFLANERGDKILEIKKSFKFTTEKYFVRKYKLIKGASCDEFNLIYKN
jgi:hypothetical protein